MSYVPRAGSVAARLVEHLSAEGAPESITAAELGELLGFPPRQIGTRLAAAIAGGAIVREQRGAAYVYRLPGDGAPEQAFEACIWDDGTVDLYGTQAIAYNGMPGVRLTHEQATHIERLLRARERE